MFPSISRIRWDMLRWRGDP